MKLAVCGCSWSSVDPQHKGIEFGSLISSHLNAEYYNLAKPGCSNFGIALQVDYALKHYDPDVFVINATTVTREEIKLKDAPRYNPKKGWDNVDFNHVMIEKYRDEHAPGYGKGYAPTIMVDSYGSMFNEDIERNLADNNMIQRYERVFTNNSFEALKKHFLYIYDADVQRHKQQMILTYALQKLQLNGKKVVFSPNTFDWAEGYDMTKRDPYALECTEWDIPKDMLQMSGIANYLSVCDELWGGWENSPGTKYDHHLPLEAHQAYAETLKPYLTT
ncbi:hypothetical protein N9O93_00315 [bacterium]|jgi:hypothetical protein|nr:hypothetical protein [bacterium]